MRVSTGASKHMETSEEVCFFMHDGGQGTGRKMEDNRKAETKEKEETR